jgi:2,4-dienoyl-CoA reductase-like NADH-dependent reductase (Old Yellow Enzyme family)
LTVPVQPGQRAVSQNVGSIVGTSQGGPRLFEPLALRSLTLRNRIMVAPMCQYSCVDGYPTDWHLVHLGSRAVGGAGLVMAEASAVEARGRISPHDAGIWEDGHTTAWAGVARFIASQGAVPAIQLAHAGRKASVHRPWNGGAPLTAEEGAWQTVSASAIPFADGWHTPDALGLDEIDGIVEAFAAATRRALEAGFQVVEIHGAHGYLLNQFLSPISNRRTDRYGGSRENRTRLVLEVVEATRAAWPVELPLFVRLSCTEWVDGGWSADDTVWLAPQLAERGVDFIDCSSGGNVATARIPMAPGYQVQFAERVRREAGVLSGAVGLITVPELAEEIVANGRADAVLLARELLRDPYWPLHAAKALGADIDYWPAQYVRARR